MDGNEIVLKMWVLNWFLFLGMVIKENLAILAEDTATIIDADIPGRQNDKFSNSIYPYVRGGGGGPSPHDGDPSYPIPDVRLNDPARRCSNRLETALDQIRRRQGARERQEDRRGDGPEAAGGLGDLHLDGYSLHQPLRSAALDMYVTDMRVRLPTSSSWVRVDSCRYDPRNASLQTRISFNDLTISGRVNLLGDRDALQRRHSVSDDDLEDLPGSGSRPACNMILRLRRAGIGFHTEPIRRERGQFNVRTDSHFLEPGFISVFAYGCEPRTRSAGGEDELAREMEDVFLRGIRSLLTAYMQRELQPAIKETLMTNMGYTVSYG